MERALCKSKCCAVDFRVIVGVVVVVVVVGEPWKISLSNSLASNISDVSIDDVLECGD
jgi:hypothetical protein